MPTVYRVERNGISFYVQPEMLGYYAQSGYQIYKQVEEIVTDVEGEVRRASEAMRGQTVTVGEEQS